MNERSSNSWIAVVHVINNISIVFVGDPECWASMIWKQKGCVKHKRDFFIIKDDTNVTSRVNRWEACTWQLKAPISYTLFAAVSKLIKPHNVSKYCRMVSYRASNDMIMNDNGNHGNHGLLLQYRFLWKYHPEPPFSLLTPFTPHRMTFINRL